MDRLHRAFPLLYLVWALPFTLTLVWLLPPWSNPDEPAHMLRVMQIAHGELLSHRIGAGQAGGLSDPAVMDAAAPFGPLSFHPERKINLAMMSASRDVRWHPHLSALSFANTAQYPPFFYLPAALGARLGQLTRMKVDRTLQFARAITAITAVLLTAAGIALARRTRWALGGIAVLPMALALNASVSQDALMLAAAILAVGWIDRIIERGQPAGSWELAGLIAALGCVAMARPPYAPFALLPLLCAGRIRWPNLFATASIILLSAAWSGYVAARVMVPLAQANPSAQVALLTAHPVSFVTLVAATIGRWGLSYVREFVGQLGWLDVALPVWYTQLACAVLIACFAAASNGVTRRSWIPAIAVLGSIVLLFAAQLIAWTAPGTPYIDGIQGRYFLPVAAVFALAVPAWPRLGALARPIAVAGLAALAAITPVVTVEAVVVRYYLGG